MDGQRLVLPRALTGSALPECSGSSMKEMDRDLEKMRDKIHETGRSTREYLRSIYRSPGFQPEGVQLPGICPVPRRRLVDQDECQGLPAVDKLDFYDENYVPKNLLPCHIEENFMDLKIKGFPCLKEEIVKLVGRGGCSRCFSCENCFKYCKQYDIGCDKMKTDCKLDATLLPIGFEQSMVALDPEACRVVCTHLRPCLIPRPNIAINDNEAARRAREGFKYWIIRGKKKGCPPIDIKLI